jgi:hypothetical protein
MTGSRPVGQFRRSVAVLASGTAISQAIPIAAMPVLTRLYTPEEFGTVVLYLALASLLGVVATARYELAIPLPHDDIEAGEIGLDPRKTRLPNTRTTPTQPASANCVNTTRQMSQKPNPLHNTLVRHEIQCDRSN